MYISKLEAASASGAASFALLAAEKHEADGFTFARLEDVQVSERESEV